MRLEELDALTAAPELWNDAARAQKLLSEKNSLEESVTALKQTETSLNELSELCKLAEEEGNRELVAEIITQLEELKAKTRRGELEALLSGEADKNDAFLEVHAGSGGTEAQDWAEMLLRMYTRWAEAHQYKVEYVEEAEGDVAGLKSATVKISGHNAYGWLKSETGVHRLVRISPFDSNARRHTSFASVGVYPDIDDEIRIEINESDCRVDTYRASGAGGQHVQKTDSAVRITHLPTGMVVECQDERSQTQNKARAMAVLASRLHAAQVAEQQAKEASERKSLIGSGDRSERIRTYNYPQGRVTDHRINLTLYRLEAIMNGDLEEIITALTTQHQAEQLAALA